MMASNTKDVPLRCRCGHVRGIAEGVAPGSGFRFVCYCTDCQAFARFLGRTDVLNAAGGTDIFHLPTGHVKLTAGREAIRCLQYSQRVFRWYCDCCKTPIGNSAGARFPIVGLILSFMDHDADGRSRDAALGPPLCSLYAGSATAPLPANAPGPPSIRLLFGRGSKLLSWWLGGLGRPNPFFDEHTRAPLSAPRVFAPGERAAADNRDNA
jgi:hypothetical protein